MPSITITVTVPANLASDVVQTYESMKGRLPGETDQDMLNRHVAATVFGATVGYLPEMEAEKARKVKETEIKNKLP